MRQLQPPQRGAQSGDRGRVRQRRGGGQRGDPPAGDGSTRRGQFGVVEYPAPAQQGGHDAGLFGGQLQPARGDEAQAAGKFPHHGGEAAMRETLLHRRQHILAPIGASLGGAGIGEHEAGGVQTGTGEAGGEQIVLLVHPQHRPLQPSQHAGEEQGGGGAMLGIRAGAGDFMQRALRHAA
jgi:hypothetical protein